MHTRSSSQVLPANQISRPALNDCVAGSRRCTYLCVPLTAPLSSSTSSSLRRQSTTIAAKQKQPESAQQKTLLGDGRVRLGQDLHRDVRVVEEVLSLQRLRRLLQQPLSVPQPQMLRRRLHAQS